MANIKVDTAVLKQAAGSLRDTAEILELQENTLNEVAAIIENAWRSSASGELADCVRKVQKNVNKTGNSLRSLTRTLNSAAAKVKEVEEANVALANK